MKALFGAVVLAAAVVAGAGCQSDQQSKKQAALPVTDIQPIAPVTAVQPVQPIQPITPAQPAAEVASATTVAAGGGGVYTVQKGDTLYRIARERYGDGKQWTRIASANPGVSPQTLKVGQKLNIP